MWNQKKLYKWTYLQNRNRPTDIEKKVRVTKGEKGWGRAELEVWDQQIQPAIYKTDKGIPCQPSGGVQEPKSHKLHCVAKKKK